MKPIEAVYLNYNLQMTIYIIYIDYELFFFFCPIPILFEITRESKNCGHLRMLP